MPIEIKKQFSQYIKKEEFTRALLLYKQQPEELAAPILEMHLNNKQFRNFFEGILKSKNFHKQTDLEKIFDTIGLKEQVEKNKNILLTNDFIGESKDGKIGILNKEGNILQVDMSKENDGSDMRECIFPDFTMIDTATIEDPDKYLDGITKGYIRLVIEPYGQTEKEFYDLFTKWHDSSENLKRLGREKSVWVLYEQQEVIEKDTMKYYSQVTASGIEGGMSRKEFIKTLKFPGFNVSFVEDILEVPRENKGKEIHGEKQVECGKKFYEYFHMSRKPQLQRAWCIDFMRRVEEEKKLLNRDTLAINGNTTDKYILGSKCGSGVGQVMLNNVFPGGYIKYGGGVLSVPVSLY